MLSFSGSANDKCHPIKFTGKQGTPCHETHRHITLIDIKVLLTTVGMSMPNWLQFTKKLGDSYFFLCFVIGKN